ncbi:Serine protease inhibitor Kazal-type 5 [Manis javanica]|nr:Serine protease inhibitor Kazal-type 5 [Manis javanica]
MDDLSAPKKMTLSMIQMAGHMADQCHEFWDMVRNGKLVCASDYDPAPGPYGKMHPNKCATCQSIFEQEANERKKNEEKSSVKPSNYAKNSPNEYTYPQ